MSSASGVLSNTPYSFATRFENEKGTNPEELIAAAHAGCFSMALSEQLGTAGLKPERIATEATVTLEKLESGFAITQVHLQTTARVPGATRGSLPPGGRKRQERLPGVETAERQNHPGRQAGRIARGGLTGEERIATDSTDVRGSGKAIR